MCYCLVQNILLFYKQVTCLTNEGKFESKPTKKRTAKDECKFKDVTLYKFAEL